MSLEKLLRRETVNVYLTDEDQMCLRRLMEHDTHEPGEVTASEAKGGVVGMAIEWALTTINRLSKVDEGSLVLHYRDGHEEDVDWWGMLQQAIDDEREEANTEIAIRVLPDIRFLDLLCELWTDLLANLVRRSAIIRFAIRWRHYSLRMWLRHQENEDEPELGIRFVRDSVNQFSPIAI